MDKRTLLAFLLIAVIIILMEPYYKMINPEQEKKFVTQDTTITHSIPAQKEVISSEEHYNYKSTRHDVEDVNNYIQEYELSSVVINTNLYTATISSLAGGSFTTYFLKEYPYHNGGNVNLIPPNSGGKNLLIKFKTLSGDTVSLTQNFQLIEGSFLDTVSVLDSPYSMTYTTQIRGETVYKTLTFNPDNYIITVSIDLSLVSKDLILPDQSALFWDCGLPITEKIKKDDLQYSAGYLYQGEELLKFNGKKNKQSVLKGQTDWVAIRSKYFAAAIIPDHSSSFGIMNIKDKSNKLDASMAAGFSTSSPASMALYLGPLQYTRIKALGVGLDNIMNFGWGFIRPIAHGVLLLLKSMYNIIPNYGVLLIIIAVLVKILVYPLTKKSYKSTKEMQAIQPLIVELRNKFKNEPQKLNQETMKLYKEHGVNPLGGCLPMLLQMPLLFALFIVFRTTIELRGAPFVWWINDLSSPDTVLYLPFTIPIYGDQVSILPILMGISMFAQQKMMGAQSQQGQQKVMMYFMTGFFFLIFNSFPSGLNLYYTLFNVLTIIQQKYFVHPDTPATAPLPSKKR